MDKHGFVRITTASNKVAVGNPKANADEHIRIIEENADSDIILFPETSVTGYTCQKLFHQKALLDAAEFETRHIANSVGKQLVVVGLPFRVGNSLFNCAAVLNEGVVVGIVPKDFIPNYNEFYEGRWFAPGSKASTDSVKFGANEVPFGHLLFKHSHSNGQDMVAFVEICEAIWMPIPPSSFAAIAGANVLLNPSASNETIGKPDYRRNLVVGQSGRCIATYAYASSHPTESTSDLVFGGHCMIAEGGHLLKESRRVGDGETPDRESYWITADVDVEKLQTERRTTTSYAESRKYLTGQNNFRTIPVQLINRNEGVGRSLERFIDARPFVPKNPATLKGRCSEIFGIQTCALAKRLECLGPNPKAVIGVSGGLDSTLALMVACKTYDMLGIPRENITGVTMPGFGTSDHTHDNADTLMATTDITVKTVDIRRACLQEFFDIGHKPFGIEIDDGTNTPDFDAFLDKLARLTPEQRAKGDLVFENVQARRRTEYLMNMGFVLGTGDMSELWLGWCTYNADQQSMYNVNAGVPKTLVKFLVEYIAEHEVGGHPGQMDSAGNHLYHCLLAIAGTTISPELLPTDEEGNIEQSTEDKIGPYELHDFFMFYLVRNGFTPEKVLCLAQQAEGWEGEYTTEDFKKWLRLNIKRAFQQQYKRDNIPNGPKVGSVALSPRGDWRMPPDADPTVWLETLK
jgi:NAD+ synthase (glutamine-hydrolysing)